MNSLTRKPSLSLTVPQPDCHGTFVQRCRACDSFGVRGPEAVDEIDGEDAAGGGDEGDFAEGEGEC